MGLTHVNHTQAAFTRSPCARRSNMMHDSSCTTACIYRGHEQYVDNTHLQSNGTPLILLLPLAVAVKLPWGRPRFPAGQPQRAKRLRSSADCISRSTHLAIGNQSLHLCLPIENRSASMDPYAHAHIITERACIFSEAGFYVSIAHACGDFVHTHA